MSVAWHPVMKARDLGKRPARVTLEGEALVIWRGTEGLGALAGYAHLLAVLIGCMLFVALVINPLIVWVKTKKNPYPLVLTALRESGMVAFFTRSSAANIPVNLALCERLDLEEDTYAVSIPLGATPNSEF